ncbi:MAG TPA: hypothetical protein VHB50_03625, partial [Bryobacteraceae bacterium]|nr:hypothetical protein [Bryobacteraceae bacterium]
MSASRKWPSRFKPLNIVLAILLLGSCLGGGFALYRWRASRSFFDLPKLLSRFPQEDATVVDINFALLRHAGLLADSKAALEPEYKQFLDGTGFDYRRDLDLMVGSFSKSGNFFIARGRFDWDKLRNYAQKQGGSCYEQLCRMQGSTP